jgi:hypothetical protein
MQNKKETQSARSQTKKKTEQTPSLCSEYNASSTSEEQRSGSNGRSAARPAAPQGREGRDVHGAVGDPMRRTWDISLVLMKVREDGDIWNVDMQWNV